MDRFADQLELALAAEGVFEVRSTAVHPTAVGRLGLTRLDKHITRLVKYPLRAARERADLYHIIDHSYAHVAALTPKARTIVTCHDLMLLVGEEGPDRLRGRRSTVARFRWSTGFLRRVAHVVCVSQSTAADVIRLCHVPEERISVVPNGVDRHFRPLPDDERARLRDELLGVETYAVLHVATAAYKNIAATLRVVSALRDSWLRVLLVRVGPPLAHGDRELAERLGLTSAVIECGVVPEERLVELYNACDVLLFPSLYEGFGWPPLEAMACGTPVVSSNRGGLPEVVADAGLMADPDDIEGLMRAVRSVLEVTALRDELRRRGIDRAKEFTWDRAINQYSRLYMDVLARAKASRQAGEAPPASRRVV